MRLEIRRYTVVLFQVRAYRRLCQLFRRVVASEDGEVGVDPEANFEVESLGQDSFCVEFEQ